MNKKSISFIAIAGVLWFLTLVIGKIPASLIINNLSQEFNVFVPSNVRGTIWHGQAAIRLTNLRPNIYLRQVTWDISPIKLLFGEFDADFNLKGDKSRQLLGHIQFDLFSHDATLTNIKGKFDSALVQPYLELPFRINSLVDLDIKKLSVVEMKPTELDGRVIIESLSLDMGQNIELGSFAADLALLDENPILLAKLQDIDAVVELSGQAQWTPPMNYFIDIEVRPKSQANPIIENTLKSFYRSNDDGGFNITIGRVLN